MKVDKLFSMLTLCISLPLALPAWAAEDGSKADLAINALLRDLAIYEQIHDISQTIGDGLEQRHNEHETADANRWKRLSDNARTYFTEAALAARMRTLLSKDYDEARYATLQRLVQSQIGKRLSEIKRAALSAQATEAIRKFAKDQHDKAPGPARASLYSQLDDASADTEFLVATQALAIQSVARLGNVVETKSQDLTPEKKDMLLRASYEQLLKPSKFTTRITYDYAFHDLSDDDLKLFIEFYRFGDMQWFLGKVMEALNTAMEQVTAEAEKKLRQ
ncbi:MAG: hypothetical protein HY273_08090 [Gammaproteobacteria bacterium]|nr:hypothetical protein [Gammaproteobacteria bacterium]